MLSLCDGFDVKLEPYVGRPNRNTSSTYTNFRILHFSNKTWKHLGSHSAMKHKQLLDLSSWRT